MIGLRALLLVIIELLKALGIGYALVKLESTGAADDVARGVGQAASGVGAAAQGAGKAARTLGDLDARTLLLVGGGLLAVLLLAR